MTKYGSDSEKRAKQLAETDGVEDHLSVDQWLKIRKDAGLRIDPETAEVAWWYALTLDPYGIHPDFPEESDCVSRERFARSPGSDIWVSFDDLPKEVVAKIRKRHRSKLAFPAGLPTFPSEKEDLAPERVAIMSTDQQSAKPDIDRSRGQSGETNEETGRWEIEL